MAEIREVFFEQDVANGKIKFIDAQINALIEDTQTFINNNCPNALDGKESAEEVIDKHPEIVLFFVNVATEDISNIGYPGSFDKFDDKDTKAFNDIKGEVMGLCLPNVLRPIFERHQARLEKAATNLIKNKPKSTIAHMTDSDGSNEQDTASSTATSEASPSGGQHTLMEQDTETSRPPEHKENNKGRKTLYWMLGAGVLEAVAVVLPYQMGLTSSILGTSASFSLPLLYAGLVLLPLLVGAIVWKLETSGTEQVAEDAMANRGTEAELDRATFPA
jgi:hypothetical protein